MRTRSRRTWPAVTLVLLALSLVSAPASLADSTDLPTGNWPVCVDPGDQFCLESVVVTPVGGVTAPVTDYGLAGAAMFTGAFNWGVTGLDDPGLPVEVRDGEFSVVIRVNHFVPQYSLAIARDVRVTRVENGDGTITMTATGHAIHRDWMSGDRLPACVAGTDCGDENTMADALGSGWVFMGYSQEITSWGSEYAALDGMSIATDAEARPQFILIGTYPELYWYMPTLGNPHLDLDGNPVRGSFHAWLPETFFTAAGTDVTSALGTGFDVVSSSGGVDVSVPAVLTAQDGGVVIDVPDLPYSVHSVTVANRASTAPDGTAPAAPGAVLATAAAGSVAVHWTAPEDDGGQALSGYTARAFTAGSAGSVAGSCAATSTTSCTITGLTADTTYYVAVTAANALGEGPASDRVATVTAPGAPTTVSVLAGAGRLTASWQPPPTDGGDPVSGYLARAWTATTGGSVARQCSAASTARQCVITGLTDGVTFRVDVVATNAAGAGTASAPRVAGLPRTAPTAPRSVLVSSRSRTVRVSWTAPRSNGGAAIIGSVASLYPTAVGPTAAFRCTATSSGHACSTGALIAGRVYFVSVTAANAVGRSLPSSPRVRVVVRP